MLATEQEVDTWMQDLYTVLSRTDRPRSFIECLDTAAQNQQQNEVFHSILQAIREVVSLGYPLSRAMSLHPEVFSNAHVCVVRYGEMYGEVDLTLQRYVERPEDREPRCRRSDAGS